MRLWQVLTAVAAGSVVMALAREPFTRTFLIVFITGLGEIAFGLASIMALFQTIGALAEARTIPAHAEALAATSLVLGVGTAVMGGWLFVGFWLVSTFV